MTGLVPAPVRRPELSAGATPTACIVLVGQETLLSVGLSTCLQQIEGVTVVRVDSVPAARVVAATRPVDVILMDGEELTELAVPTGPSAVPGTHDVSGATPVPRSGRLRGLNSSARVADVVAQFSRVLRTRRRPAPDRAGPSPVPVPRDPSPGPSTTDREDEDGLPYTFSDREREVLQLASVGQPNGTIARALGLSEATVKTYWQRIFEKVGTRDRTGAVATAMATGLILGPGRRMPTVRTT